MELLYILIKVLAASQVMLFIGILFISKNPLFIRAIGITLMTAILSYLFNPLFSQYTDTPYINFISVLASLIPILMLIFVWAIFEEGCIIPKWMIGLFLIDMCLSIWLVTGDNPSSEIELLGQLLKVFSAAYAIYITWRGKENDLVEMRLKARLVFIGALSVTVLSVTLTKVFQIYDVNLPGRLLGNLWMLGISMLGNISFIKMNPSLSLVGDPKELVVKELPEDPAIVQLLDRMQSERLYADHDLRVASLAALIGIPEYQLRQKINKSLGYRNFNQFVNRYRIEEAGIRLIQDLRIPVLSIALDVGFRSISSFNTAFQAQFGVSPTQYRAQALPKS